MIQPVMFQKFTKHWFPVVQADQVYLLMKKEYRISRNIRASWYFHHLNENIELQERQSLAEYKGELDVLSVIPRVSERGGGHAQQQYRVTPSTDITFFAHCYRIVFVLDLSPSTGIVYM
ncbi:PREDICTED: protein SZT2-like [Priapulus caudatus]|uniref:Protein SZT2-like n=1 Tax=Priapulus caudatus TaxID=37621 RepID=A0ABM1E8F7_PRICU|nr:PREDICTED: protein SZT2-like [Priapulus caudatus]